MLPWKVEAFDTNTTCPKDLTMVVKSLKGILSGHKTVRIVYVASSYVAKFKEGAHCLHHLIWHMTFNCW
jgi:hypothetical protein